MKHGDLIILFGSRARGRECAHSDADVAVLADRPLSIREKIKIAEKLSSELDVSEDIVDVVDLRRAPPLLQYQIAKYGKLLYGNENDFLRFKVLAWKRYLDTAKFRRIRSERLKQSAYAV